MRISNLLEGAVQPTQKLIHTLSSPTQRHLPVRAAVAWARWLVVAFSRHTRFDEADSVSLVHRRASNWLAAAMIFLTQGPLDAKKELKQDMIKKCACHH